MMVVVLLMGSGVIVRSMLLSTPFEAWHGLLVAPARGRELLAQAFGVFRDDGRGGIEDFLARAIILLDAQDVCAREIFRESQDMTDVGAAPAIDRLILIADDEEVRLFARD